MTATSTETPATKAAEGRAFANLSLRWKLTATFGALFTILFAFIAIWVVQFSANTAQNRLEDQLALHVQGGSETVDGDTFRELVATVPPAPDPANESGFGYPDSPLYVEIAQTLYNIRRTVNAGTYTWFKDPADGKLYTAASSGYFLNPQTGYTFKVPLDTVAGPSTYALMEQGLSQTVKEPPYSDAYGSWISAYTPILDSQGNVVGGIGQDYPLTYVDEVRSQSIRQVLPVLLLSYLVLLALVLVVSTRIVRPIKRLTSAATRIADGDYDADIAVPTNVRLRDEIYTLASAFSVMSRKVQQREESLKKEVTRLKVEIDHSRRTEAVRQITESEGFADIAAKAAEMRRRMNEGREG